METEKTSREKLSKQHLHPEQGLESDLEKNLDKVGKKEPGKALSYLLVTAVGIVLLFSIVQAFQLNSLKEQVNQINQITGKVVSTSSTGLDQSGWTENEKMMYEHHGTLPARLQTGNRQSTDELSAITLYKSESCGCCDLYLKYLEKKDYTVMVKQMDDLAPIKDKYNIPRQLQSCHTSIIGDYFVEGHVPVEAIARLIAEKPDIAGIALPGMPSGSPGMPGAKQGTWTIQAVGKDGAVTEFMKI